MDSKGYLKKFNTSYEIKMSSDGKYIARTSGASIYVHDTENFEQVAIFKDMKYANQIIFSHDNKLLAAKSAEPKIAVYDLENLKLINKIYVRKTSQTQDGGFCFSKDNKFIYNTVYTNDLLGYISKINIYSGDTQIIYQPNNCVFDGAKYIKEKDIYLFTGFERTNYENIHFIIEYNEENNEFKRIDIESDFYKFVYHKLNDIFIVYSLASKDIKIISNNYNSIIQKLNPLLTVTKKTSFFDVIESSKKLKEKLSQDEEKYEELRRLSEENEINVSAVSLINNINISNNGKYLAVVMTNCVKIYDFETFDLLDEIKNEYCCYVSFSPDDSLILIGTWSHGFIYPFSYGNDEVD